MYSLSYVPFSLLSDLLSNWKWYRLILLWWYKTRYYWSSPFNFSCWAGWLSIIVLFSKMWYIRMRQIHWSTYLFQSHLFMSFCEIQFLKNNKTQKKSFVFAAVLGRREDRGGKLSACHYGGQGPPGPWISARQWMPAITKVLKVGHYFTHMLKSFLLHWKVCFISKINFEVRK